MIQVNFKKSNFLITDFKARGALSNRALVRTNAGTYFYDVYSRSVENYSFVADTAPITQVQNFKISFHSLKSVSPSNSSLGFLLTFPSGGFIVFDRDFSDETKLKVFVSPEQEYSPNPLSSPFDSYTCLNPYPHLNQILQTTHSMSISILNKDARSKLVTLKINEVIIFEGNIDFKTLGLKDFNIGIHNFNNDLRVTSMSVEGDDSKDIIVNKTSYQYWRVSNIKNRRADQFYRSVGNLIFKAKSGEVSDNPAYGFSESHFDSDSLPGNAFDGLDSTYTLSSSLEDGTNTQEHGNSWWIGYKFLNPVEIESIDISMRYDMEGVVDNLIDNSLGQDWVSFQVDGSDNGIDWNFVYTCPEPKIFKNDNSLHSYKLNIEGSLKSDRWRVTNITNLQSSPNDTHYYITVEELSLNSDDSINVIKVSSNSNSPHRVENILLKNSRSLYENDWQNRSILPYIEFQFEAEVEIQSVDLKMRYDMNPAWYQEWQTADLFYFKNDRWILYGNITPKISHMNLAPIEGVPVNKFSDSKLVYQKPTNTDNKYKFWRCNNIKSLGSLDTLIDYRSQSILKFINQEGIELMNKFNSFSSSEYPLELPQGLTINSFDNSENTWSTSGSINESNILAAENYSIGCMFNTPVDVYKFGYKPRKNQNYNWGQTWTSCNIQYSPNGFEWYDRGYCEINIPRGTFYYYESPIKSIENLPKYKFWRVKEVFRTNAGVTPFSNQGWELRFNTLTGEISNIPSRGFSTNYWDNTWTPNRAFDGNVSTSAGGFHQANGNTEPFHIGYEFQTPQYVDSISILMRRDSWYDYNTSNWVYATIESSEDGITWIHQGYSNVNTSTNTRFYTAPIEKLNATDLLNATSIQSLSSVKLSSFTLEKFNSLYLDPKITNLNIYNPDSNGVVKGQVLELNEPVIREVAIYDRRTRQLIAITWSNEEGFYEFKNLNSSKTYYVHAIDSNKIYNAVTKDMLEPLK